LPRDPIGVALACGLDQPCSENPRLVTCEVFGKHPVGPGGERPVTAPRRTTGRRGSGRQRPSAKRRRQFVRLVVIVAGLLVVVAMLISGMPPPPIVGPAQPVDTSAPPQPGN